MSQRLPWEDGCSILELVREREGSDQFNFALPDEPAPGPTQIGWAAGALDGVATRHPPPVQGASPSAVSPIPRLAEKRDVPAEIIARLRQLGRHPTDEERLALYWIAQHEEILAHANAVLERLRADRQLLAATIAHARWLVHESRHRGPLKLGIVLLSACGEPSDAETLKTLARHAEFTLYCSVALTNISPEPVDALWEVATSAEGWGKIEAVERLAQLVGDRDEIKRWLLTEGCENSVMNDYLAYACASAGDLAGALAGEVDDELLDGACTIVSALSSGGPAKSLYDYADGAFVCERFVEHLEERCSTLERLCSVIDLALWLERAEAPECQARLATQGWSRELPEELHRRCMAIVGRSQWPEQVRDAFERGRGLAWWAAPHVGVDLWEPGFRQLVNGPLDDSLVWKLMDGGDIERQRRVVAWAEQTLPLDPVASGPERRLLRRPDQGVLDGTVIQILQEMRESELYSEPLVAAALLSPVSEARGKALIALENHPRDEWGATVEEALERLREQEPDPGICELLLEITGSAGSR